MLDTIHINVNIIGSVEAEWYGIYNCLEEKLCKIVAQFYQSDRSYKLSRVDGNTHVRTEGVRTMAAL